MRRIIPAAALLLLAACGGDRHMATRTAGPEDPGVAECRAEARQAPAPNVARQANPANGLNVARLAQEREALETRAFTECVLRRGLSRGGGVETVRRFGL
jgi:hypothetical protein